MQINSINNSTNFGMKFTKRAQEVIQNSINEYEKDSYPAKKFRSLYTSMQNDEFNDVILDVNEKGYLTFTLPIAEFVTNTYKNKNGKNSIFYESLNTAYIDIARRVKQFKRI